MSISTITYSTKQKRVAFFIIENVTLSILLVLIKKYVNYMMIKVKERMRAFTNNTSKVPR